MSSSSSVNNNNNKYKKLKPDLDVAILGAGISGICAAYYLKYDDNKNCTGTRNFHALRSGKDEVNFKIFERRPALGGTWDLFRYPGIRSDAEMVNFSFPFFPWKKKQRYGSGSDILEYLKETVDTFVLDKHIQYNTDVKEVSWSDEDGCWTLTIQKRQRSGTSPSSGKEKDDDDNDDSSAQTTQVTAQFVVFGTGYYSYDKPHWPVFPEQDAFKGDIVHAQLWDPSKVDYVDKKVVVIGSGATAISVVPHVADKAKSVTMLQRSPTYVIAFPRTQWTTDLLVDYVLPYFPPWVFYWLSWLMRWYANILSVIMFSLVRYFKEVAKKSVLAGVKKELGPSHAHLMPHFTPRYYVWDERACVDTSSDLFKSIKSGKATIETATIEKFTKDGILVKCMLGADKGKEKLLEADLVVVCTGLTIQSRGGTRVVVNGKDVPISSCYYYRGCMFKDVPNLFSVFGYFNASWFNKALLIAEYTQRLIAHCKASKQRVVVPRSIDDSEIQGEGLVTFMQSGYLMRGKEHMPQQGTKWPWKMYQNYLLDLALIKWAPLNDKRLEYRAE